MNKQYKFAVVLCLIAVLKDYLSEWWVCSLQAVLCTGRQELCMSTCWLNPHLCGPAAGPVRGSDGDVDTGRGLCVGGVSPFSSRQPRDNQATGKTTLPKQQAESGRRRGDLKEGHVKKNTYLSSLPFIRYSRLQLGKTCSQHIRVKFSLNLGFQNNKEETSNPSY